MQKLYHSLGRIALLGALYWLIPFSVAHAGRYVDFVTSFADEAIILACVATWLISTLVSAYYTPPDGSTSGLGRGLKAILSLLGGLLAFLYVLNVDKQLTLLHPIWVAVVTLMSPAIFVLGFAGAVELIRTIVKSASAKALAAWQRLVGKD